jgi:predicted esterase
MSLTFYHHLFRPAAQADAVTLLLLHGTGGTENDLVPLAQKIAPGAALLAPRGDVSERGQLRFFRRHAEGVFDLEDVVRRTHALADFVGAAAKRYGFSPRRLFALGFSNGANVTATLMQLRAEVLGGGVLLRAMVVLSQTAAPDTLRDHRALLLAGAHDPIVPSDHPEKLAALLRAGGAAVEVKTSEATHNLAPADLEAAQDFFHRMTDNASV